MSFFDEDDEPRKTTTRPRPRRGAGSSRAAANDPQTLLLRRAVALGGIVVLLIVLGLLVNSCRSSQRKNDLKDYAQHVESLGTESQQTGAEFFKLLGRGGSQSPQDLQTAISGFRVQAEQQLKQAQGLSVPSEMTAAQQSFLIELEQRRDGLDAIAQRIRTALGDESDAANRAIREIAGQNAVFLSSDVLDETRVVPFVRQALKDGDVTGQGAKRSTFLPDTAWLAPTFVADKLGQQVPGGAEGGRRPGQPTGPGLHGTGLDSVSYGSVRVVPGTPNRLTYAPGDDFIVKFTNQGDNDEFDVKVTVRITGAGSKPITLTKTVNQIAQGASATANLPLTTGPPLNTAVTIDVNVAAVPGEKKTDNNKATYQALFSRG